MVLDCIYSNYYDALTALQPASEYPQVEQWRSAFRKAILPKLTKKELRRVLDLVYLDSPKLLQGLTYHFRGKKLQGACFVSIILHHRGAVEDWHLDHAFREFTTQAGPDATPFFEWYDKCPRGDMLQGLQEEILRALDSDPVRR